MQCDLSRMPEEKKWFAGQLTRANVKIYSFKKWYFEHSRLELKYKLTRNLLEILLSQQKQISILTKSHNILRDLDLLAQFQSCSVGMSLNSIDDDFRRVIEPRASSVMQRINTLQHLKEHNISTYAFLGPIFPGFSNIPAIFELIKDSVDAVNR